MKKIFTVYNSKSESYMNPFFMHATGEAIRGFVDVANDTNSQIGKYPSDFTLFELGEYNEFTCEFNIYSTPKSLGLALDFVTSKH